MNAIPEPSEQNRQKLIHALRVSRVNLVKGLKTGNFTDNGALSALMQVNSQIEMLKYLRDGGPDMSDEPSFEDIELRSTVWFWDVVEDDEDDE